MAQMNYSEEEIRKAISKALSTFSIDITKLPFPNEVKMQIYKTALRLIKLILNNLGINNEKMLEVINQKRLNR